MSTSILSKKLIPNNIPGDFNYLNYHHGQGVKKGYQLVPVNSKAISKLEEATFEEIIKIEYLAEHRDEEEEYKPKVKADLPLGSQYSKIDPRWLLFHRGALKKLQYA